MQIHAPQRQSFLKYPASLAQQLASCMAKYTLSSKHAWMPAQPFQGTDLWCVANSRAGRFSAASFCNVVASDGQYCTATRNECALRLRSLLQARLGSLQVKASGAICGSTFSQLTATHLKTRRRTTSGLFVCQNTAAQR